MLSRLFSKDKTREAARELYRDIILRAREPVFYERLGVPDTVEGRFDMITLHMFLLLRRLRREEDKTESFAQTLFDVMFKNMDESYREMGVGDLKVGKKVRKLAEDFYGRINAYEKALEDEHDTLADALRRNILGQPEDDETALNQSSQLAEYVTACDRTLAEQKIDRLVLGFVDFPSLKASI